MLIRNEKTLIPSDVSTETDLSLEPMTSASTQAWSRSSTHTAVPLRYPILSILRRRWFPFHENANRSEEREREDHTSKKRKRKWIIEKREGREREGSWLREEGAGLLVLGGRTGTWHQSLNHAVSISRAFFLQFAFGFA